MAPLLHTIFRDRRRKLLQGFLSPDDRVLEVGPGNGWLAATLSAEGYDVTTLDIVPPADIVGDINDWRDLGIRRHSFDVIVALEVIEHVDALEALQAVCKPFGLIMMSSPHPNWDWVMKVAEALHLNQRRTSPHDNLTDFAEIPMPAVMHKRPMWVHQVAIFRNVSRAPARVAGDTSVRRLTRMREAFGTVARTSRKL